MLLDWIKKNREIFKIIKFEEKGKLPKDSIRKAIDNKQGFPDKWNQTLYDYLKNINDSLSKALEEYKKSLK
jgi:hypothetical protein